MFGVQREKGASEYHKPRQSPVELKRLTQLNGQNDALAILLFLSAVFCKARWQMMLHRCLNVNCSCRFEDSKQLLCVVYFSDDFHVIVLSPWAVMNCTLPIASNC
jgi:hypothetical protein